MEFAYSLCVFVDSLWLAAFNYSNSLCKIGLNAKILSKKNTSLIDWQGLKRESSQLSWLIHHKNNGPLTTIYPRNQTLLSHLTSRQVDIFPLLLDVALIVHYICTQKLNVLTAIMPKVGCPSWKGVG